MWTWRQRRVDEATSLGTRRIPEATGTGEKQGRILPSSLPREHGLVTRCC